MPKLDKKIVYLDQCFVSSLFREDDPIIKDAGEILHELARYHVVVAPFSEFHEIESLQWKSARQGELYQFIKSIARGHKFESHEIIKRRQTWRAFRSFLARENPRAMLQREDAFPKDINCWDDYMWINILISTEDPAETTRLKTLYADRLVACFPQWRV